MVEVLIIPLCSGCGCFACAAKKWRGDLIKLFERSVAGSNHCPQYFTNSIFVVGHDNFNFAVSPVDQSAQGGAVGVQQTAQNARRVYFQEFLDMPVEALRSVVGK